mmetsp:Transcript_21213/g.44273  ORF Transcript_21213/g.44273 Transcript_21213/m.44273 type:complete len:236 (+) Transcript_21213:334-1041(+)
MKMFQPSLRRALDSANICLMEAFPFLFKRMWPDIHMIWPTPGIKATDCLLIQTNFWRRKYSTQMSIMDWWLAMKIRALPSRGMLDSPLTTTGPMNNLESCIPMWASKKVLLRSRTSKPRISKGSCKRTAAPDVAIQRKMKMKALSDPRTPRPTSRKALRSCSMAPRGKAVKTRAAKPFRMRATDAMTSEEDDHASLWELNVARGCRPVSVLGVDTRDQALWARFVLLFRGDSEVQ